MRWDEDIILFITTTHTCLQFGRTEKAKKHAKKKKKNMTIIPRRQAEIYDKGINHLRYAELLHLIQRSKKGIWQDPIRW